MPLPAARRSVVTAFALLSRPSVNRPWAVRSVSLAAVASLAATLPAAAAITWTGGAGNGSIADDGNWDVADFDIGDDGVLEDGDLIFAGAVQTAVEVDIDYSGIDSIVFAGDADTFTLDGDGDGTVESLTFNDGGSIINNSTVAGDMTFGAGLELIFGGATAVITNNDANDDSAIVIDSAISLAGGSTALQIDGTGDVTIGGIIAGAGGSLSWDGTGTLTLGAANTYDGGTTLSAGTVLLGDAAAFGTGVVTVDGNTTLGATGGAVAGIANQFLVTSGTVLTIGGSENIELAGSLTGNGSLFIDMAGSADVLTLSAGNGGLLGGVTLAEGTLIVSDPNALGAGTFTVTGQDGNAILQSGVDALTITNAISLDDGMGTAVLDVTGANTLTLAGEITGDGDLEVGLDDGVFLTLGGTNAMWSGDLIIDNAGAGVIVTNDDAIGTGELSMEANGELRAGGGARTLDNAIDLGASTLTIGAGTALELSGVVSGSGVLEIDAADTRVTLSGTSTHTGTTTLTDGTLVLASDDALGDGGGGASFNVAGGTIGTAGAEITIDENITVSGDFAFEDLADGSLTLSGTVDLGDAARTISSAADEDIIFSGVISSTGQDDALIKDGSGRLILSGANAGWNGGVTLDRGSLGVGNDDALGGGTLTIGGDEVTLFAYDAARTLANDIDLADNVLTVGGDQDLTLDGAITESGGSGSVVVDISGTLTISSAANAWAGGTTIQKGDLVIGDSEALGTGDITFNGGSLAAGVAGITLDEAIIAGGDFTIQGAEDLALSGDISGDGGFTVDFDDDADLLTLSGTNSFAGALAIAQGMVDAQNGDAIGDESAVTFGGADAGVLMLSADETIGGLGGGDASDGVVLGANTLTLGGAGSTLDAFAGVISGTGGLAVTGGTHLLDGANTFTGATTVSGGTLGGGGSLAGSLTIQDGGTFDAGAADAVGDFTVGGDFSLADGATWIVDISGNDVTMFDTLQAAGTATLADGATIDVDLSQASGTYIVSNTAFEILTAAGGITDDGVSVMTDSATLQFYLLEGIGVDPDFEDGDTTLSLLATRATDAFSNPNVVNAGNNRRIGAALDQLIPIADANMGMGDAASLLAQLQVLDAEGLNEALQALAPTAGAASGSVAMSGASSFSAVQGGYLASRREGTAGFFLASPSLDNPSSLSRSIPPGALASAVAEPWVFGEAVRERGEGDELDVETGPADSGGMNAWAKLYTFQSDLDEDGSRTGYDGEFVGGQGGVDWQVGDSLVVGLGFGVLSTEVDFTDAGGQLDGEGFRIGPYLGWQNDDWFVDASLSYGISDYEQLRRIAVPGQAVRTARGTYDGEDLTGYVSVGRAFQFDGGWRLTPQVSLRYSTFDFDGYTETGADVQNMTILDRSQDSIQSRVGVTFSRRFVGDRLTFVPEISVGWEHEFEEYDDVEAAFVVGGSPFTVDVGTPVENSMYLGGGVSMLLDERFAAFVRYDGLWGDGGDTQGLTFGLNISF